uniref:Uncharacterized protein n=1 Tax=Moniliophthora roreri TaxID=221103 RepID=A0A0W0FYB3_MONRR
MFAQHILVEGT